MLQETFPRNFVVVQSRTSCLNLRIAYYRTCTTDEERWYQTRFGSDVEGYEDQGRLNKESATRSFDALKTEMSEMTAMVQSTQDQIGVIGETEANVRENMNEEIDEATTNLVADTVARTAPHDCESTSILPG